MTPEKLRKTAQKLRAQAEKERNVKCAQIVDAMSALNMLKRRLYGQER